MAPRLPAGRAVHGHCRAHRRTPEPGAGNGRSVEVADRHGRRGRRARALEHLRCLGQLARRPGHRHRPRAVGQRAAAVQRDAAGRRRQRRCLEAPARLPAAGASQQPRLRAVRADPAGTGAAAQGPGRGSLARHAARHRLAARTRLCAQRLRPEPGHLVVAQSRARRAGPRRRGLDGAAAGAGADAGVGAQPARRRPAPQLPEQAPGQPRAAVRLAGRSGAARRAGRAAPGAPATAQQPGRPLQAPGRHRPASEPAAQ